MIPISAELKEKLEKVRAYLEILESPLGNEVLHEGVHAVRDDNDRIIPGCLQYGNSPDKDSVTLLGGIHMNELSGIYALLEFHDRWLKGHRPENTTVLTGVGHPGRSRAFIDAIIQMDEVAPTTWSRFGRTEDFFNFNRIPEDILSGRITSGPHGRRAYDLVKKVVIPSRGRILDIHNTSTIAPPMLTLFMEEEEPPMESVRRIKATNATRGLPVHDFIIWQPGPYNGVESIRSFGKRRRDAVPILVETGAGFDPESFDRADLCLRIWLSNIAGLDFGEFSCPDSWDETNQNYYVEADALYHPHVRPRDYQSLAKDLYAKAEKDTLVLIRDRASLENIHWSAAARRVLDTLDERKLHKNRLDNFQPIFKNEIIALGIETGLEIRCPRDGFVLMVGTDPFVEPTFNESFANIGIKVQGT